MASDPTWKAVLDAIKTKQQAETAWRDAGHPDPSAEIASLRAKIEAVERLAAEWADEQQHAAVRRCAGELRALLDPECETCGWKGEVREGDACPDCGPVAPALGLDQPWPLAAVLERLIDAAKHLRDDHDCDRHGYEEDHEAIVFAMRYLALLAPDAPHPLTEGE